MTAPAGSPVWPSGCSSCSCCLGWPFHEGCCGTVVFLPPSLTASAGSAFFFCRGDGGGGSCQPWQGLLLRSCYPLGPVSLLHYHHLLVVTSFFFFFFPKTGRIQFLLPHAPMGEGAAWGQGVTTVSLVLLIQVHDGQRWPQRLKEAGKIGSKVLHCTANASRNLITKLVCLAIFCH